MSDTRARVSPIVAIAAASVIVPGASKYGMPLAATTSSVPPYTAQAAGCTLRRLTKCCTSPAASVATTKARGSK